MKLKATVAAIHASKAAGIIPKRYADLICLVDAGDRLPIAYRRPHDAMSAAETRVAVSRSVAVKASTRRAFLLSALRHNWKL
jgi:hypothetical protein